MYFELKYYKWLLLLGTLVSYFISLHLPVAWGWENSLLEWLQILILSFGLVLNCRWWQEAKAARDLSNARFLGWGAPLWFLMIARELSWGRVFYPSGFDAVNGPTFLTLSQLPYGPLVNPLLAILIVTWLYMVIKHGLYKIPYKLLREGRFPVAEMAITVFAFVVAELGEKILHLQSMEEFVECFAYLGLILTTYCVKTALRKEGKYR
jgi:hypothetical protein